jgi:hypothetical protein
LISPPNSDIGQGKTVFIRATLFLDAKELIPSEPMNFTMYNFIREGIKAAERLLLIGKPVKIEWSAGKHSEPKTEMLSKKDELLKWKDFINAIVLQDRRDVPSGR